MSDSKSGTTANLPVDNVEVSLLVDDELVAQTMDVINEAFMVDRFFKHEQYHNRATIDSVRAIMNKGNETQEAYLVATYSEPSPASDAKASASFPSAEDNSNPVATTNPRRHVTGVILVDWELKDIDATTNKAAEAHSDNKTNTTSSRKMLWTSFSQVSVPPRHGKRGLGKKLVDGAEKFCVELSKKMAKDLGLEKPLPTTMEILVLNVRPELEGWYSRQGYVTTRKDAPFPAPEIVLPGYDVKGVMMEKTLIE